MYNVNSKIKASYLSLMGLIVVLSFQNCSLPEASSVEQKSSNLDLGSKNQSKLLFKTNFGPGIALGIPYGYYTNGKGAWQDITGTDQNTGFSWPVSVLGSNFSGVQLITHEAITPLTIENHISNEIREVVGPNGNLVHELYQSVKIKAPVGEGGAQAPLLIRRSHTIGDVTDLYISYWFKHQADLETQLDNTVSSGNWRVQFEFKTGGYENTGNGDYRIQTTILKGTDGKLYWMSKGDNVANGPWPRIDYWIERNHTVPVPIDKWFKYEVFWHRSNGADGRYWSAINGEVVVDHWGPNMGDYNLPINRIFIVNPYSGGRAPVESHVTDVEIWDGFPCGTGKSCYEAPGVEL